MPDHTWRPCPSVNPPPEALAAAQKIHLGNSLCTCYGREHPGEPCWTHMQIALALTQAPKKGGRYIFQTAGQTIEVFVPEDHYVAFLRHRIEVVRMTSQLAKQALAIETREKSVVKELSTPEVQNAVKTWLESGGVYGAAVLPAFVETIEKAREAIRRAREMMELRLSPSYEKLIAWLALPAVIEAIKEKSG